MHYCGAQATYPEVVARRAGALSAEAGIPPYLVLLRVGFALPGALLLRRCALTAPFHPTWTLRPGRYVFCGTFRRWSPTLAQRTRKNGPPLPDVIRHTALRSSDFPLFCNSDRPVRLPTASL